jgi:RimJ/RimL family protein N-acetyltransferase
MTTCKLSKITKYDKDDLYRITSDIDTMKSIGNGRPWDEKKVDNFIYYNSVDSKQSLDIRTNFYWGMKIEKSVTKSDDKSKDKSSKKFIGVVGIHTVNYGKSRNQFYVTIFIDKTQVNKGFGTVFLKMAISKFMKLKPDTPIYADIEESNIASQKLHTKLGFKPVGKLHKIIPSSQKMYQTYIIHTI